MDYLTSKLGNSYLPDNKQKITDQNSQNTLKENNQYDRKFTFNQISNNL